MAAVRRYAEDSLRYYATALLTEREYRKLLEQQMETCAYFLAILEANATEPRTVMARRQRLVERCLEEVKTRPWTRREAKLSPAVPHASGRVISAMDLGTSEVAG